jgi:cytoskeletal protein RodZ
MSARLPQFYLIGYTMDSIKALEKIGLREVSRKTYIELSYLQLMADRDFAKLHRIKTLGFVKIIKRECGIDMSDWVAEFEAYLQENEKKSGEKKEDVSLPVERWYKKLSLYINKQKNIYAVIGVFFLIIITVVFYALLKTRTAHVEDISLNAYQNIIITDTALQADSTENATENAVLDNQTADTNQSVSAKTETVQSNETIVSADAQTSTVSVPKRANRTAASISPNIEIWVGIIDLTTFNKSTYLQGWDIKLDTSKEQIIVTGHGDFRLKTEGEPIKYFNPQNMIYLHIKDGVITQISEEEFIRLNRGRNW